MIEFCRAIGESLYKAVMRFCRALGEIFLDPTMTLIIVCLLIWLFVDPVE